MIIGIMSMQRITNYGSFLQAWGLRKTLEEMGSNVQFVDFTVEPPLVSKGAAATERRSLFQRLTSMLSPSYRRHRAISIKVNQTFGEFAKVFQTEYFPLLGVPSEKNIRPVIDLLIIGSDEVFHCMQPVDNVGYSLELFGKGNRAKRLISYAASFGATTIEQIHQYHKEQELGDLLSRFHALSVRDENSALIVQRLCEVTPLRHIDPVLLYDFHKEVPSQVPMDNYVILYSYCGRFSEKEGTAAREFAHAQGKKLISLGFWQEWCDEYRKANPFEVLAYFQHADYVITDTFHGTIMSIKYNKPFVCLVRQSNKQKMQGLLSEFDMTDRIVESPEEFSEKLLRSMDYSKANAHLEKQQALAKAYLQEQIQAAK